MTITLIIAALVSFIVGLGIGLFLLKASQKQLQAAAKIKAQELMSDAKIKSGNLVGDAKAKAKRIERESKDKVAHQIEKEKIKLDNTYNKKIQQAQMSKDKAKNIENALQEEKNTLQEARKLAEKEVSKAEQTIVEQQRLTQIANSMQEEYKQKNQDIIEKLEKVANMTQKEAGEVLFTQIEDDTKLRAAKSIKTIEETAKDEAEKLSKNVISVAISRYASDYINERSTSSISLPSDELKGRLIGREGRNIRAIEAATGCDMIIDDTPETVIVSCFNPVRRHIGKMVLEQLIDDGRIHPSRIEELVAKTTKKIDRSVKEAGDKALLELGLVSMHPELLKTIGQLQYRYSYNQNQYHHVIETGHLCGLMAAELNLDIKKARRAGLLHDIGKALTHEIEGSHAVIGADLCKKFGEADDIVYAVRAHHEDVKPKSWLDFLVMGADAISGARPGARREQLDNYIKRVSELERIANEFQGVERSYAINAGREVRVMVQNSKVNDQKAIVLSNDIAKEIEKSMTYPGQIKVTVIRETRASSLAK